MTSEDKIKMVEGTKVPSAEEQKPIDEITIKSFSSSMKPRSDKNERLIMSHIPV